MIRRTLLTATLAVASVSAVASVAPDEAAQLGKTRARVGGDKAGNTDNARACR